MIGLSKEIVFGVKKRQPHKKIVDISIKLGFFNQSQILTQGILIFCKYDKCLDISLALFVNLFEEIKIRHVFP